MAKHLMKSIRNIPRDSLEMDNLEENETEVQEMKSIESTPEAQYRKRKEVKPSNLVKGITEFSGVTRGMIFISLKNRLVSKSGFW